MEFWGFINTGAGDMRISDKGSFLYNFTSHLAFFLANEKTTNSTTPFIIRLKVEVSCVLFLTQPVCMVPNQNTQNLYLQVDDKRCINKLTLTNPPPFPARAAFSPSFARVPSVRWIIDFWQDYPYVISTTCVIDYLDFIHISFVPTLHSTLGGYHIFHIYPNQYCCEVKMLPNLWIKEKYGLNFSLTSE